MNLRRRPFAVFLLVAALLVGAGSAVLAAPPSAVPQSQGQGGPNFDPQDVLDTLYQWALGYDEREPERMRDAFTDDATFVYGSPAFDEPLVFRGIDEIMALFEGALESQDDVRRHVMSNPIIERLDRRTVEVTSYLTLFSIPDPAGSPILQSTGVYRDTLVLEDDGKWRIRVRDLRLDSAA